MFTDLLKSIGMGDNHAEAMAEGMAKAMVEEMLEMMEVDNGGAVGGELVVKQDPFEEKKDMLVELETAGVEGVEDMAVQKCPGCGIAWIEHLCNQFRFIKIEFLYFFTLDSFRTATCPSVLCGKNWCRYLLLIDSLNCHSSKIIYLET